MDKFWLRMFRRIILFSRRYFVVFASETESLYIYEMQKVFFSFYGKKSIILSLKTLNQGNI